jgi:hypothetical protein
VQQKDRDPCDPGFAFTPFRGLAVVEQRLRLLRPLGVILLDLPEELGQLLIAFLLGVLDVLVVGSPAFKRVVLQNRPSEDS